ncbi:MAG: prenyltransferase/squalene oxidase repeat-containing protein [Actinomycetota bacterium]|nr:prenyltransferase/squalene oxidase repeat-containing protein [Actinomycetota bacterium]MDP2289065.1 prenyltransferase/squalene oxidase repeat-containing protein [Actinomycetota bacterium]
MSRLGRSIIGITGISLAAASLIGPAIAATPNAGLFGAADPTYDGVYRQSLSIIALQPLKKVPAAATAWLKSQQCADGSFMSYRSSLTTPCPAADPSKFSGPDSNSTALAATALRAVQDNASADKAINALVAKQNADGGWGYTLGGTSDVNSTGLVLTALHGAATLPVNAASMNKAQAYLKKAQVPCTGTGTFGLPYQPGGKADYLASAQGLIGIVGSLPVAKPAKYAPVKGTNCNSDSAARVSAFLANSLVSTKGALPSTMDPTQPDYNTSATAVVALASSAKGQAGVLAGLAELQQHVTAFTLFGPKFKVAAAAALIQVAEATGTNPRSFGSEKTNLVANLLNSITK